MLEGEAAIVNAAGDDLACIVVVVAAANYKSLDDEMDASSKRRQNAPDLKYDFQVILQP